MFYAPQGNIEEHGCCMVELLNISGRTTQARCTWFPKVKAESSGMQGCLLFSQKQHGALDDVCNDSCNWANISSHIWMTSTSCPVLSGWGLFLRCCRTRSTHAGIQIHGRKKNRSGTDQESGQLCATFWRVAQAINPGTTGDTAWAQQFVARHPRTAARDQ